MIDRINPIAAMNPPQTRIGALTDTELLLVSVIQGKRVLHSILLLLERSDPSGLLEHLWQAELTEAWVMPGTILSRAATCAWFERLSPSWVVLPHPNVRQPTRPDCVLLWPKDRSTGRRLVLIFPEHAGWGWAETSPEHPLRIAIFTVAKIFLSFVQIAYHQKVYRFSVIAQVLLR